MEVARILKEEGYINNFSTKGEGVKYMIRVFLRYDAKGTSSITHLSRVSTSGPPRLCRFRRDPESSRRIRREYRFDVEGLDERKDGPCRKRRRRDLGRSLLRVISGRECGS